MYWHSGKGSGYSICVRTSLSGKVEPMQLHTRLIRVEDHTNFLTQEVQDSHHEVRFSSHLLVLRLES